MHNQTIQKNNSETLFFPRFILHFCTTKGDLLSTLVLFEKHLLN